MILGHRCTYWSILYIFWNTPLLDLLSRHDSAILRPPGQLGVAWRQFIDWANSFSRWRPAPVETTRAAPKFRPALPILRQLWPSTVVFQKGQLTSFRFHPLRVPLFWCSSVPWWFHFLNDSTRRWSWVFHEPFCWQIRIPHIPSSAVDL